MNEPAAPPGWYRDPTGSHRLRYWNGALWAEHWRPYPDPVTPALVLPTARAPRSLGSRVLATLGLIVGWYVGVLIISVAFVFAIDDGDSASAASQIFSGLISLLLFGWLAGKVSFRWFDALFMLVPVYGFFWCFRMLWRAAYLPYRDWLPRPDESAGWVRVPAPHGRSTPHYLLAEGGSLI